LAAAAVPHDKAGAVILDGPGRWEAEPKPVRQLIVSRSGGPSHYALI
jgi:hypothetical protein